MPRTKSKRRRGHTSQANGKKAAALSYIAETLRPLAVPIQSLSPDPSNARTHTEANLAAIRGSLAHFGQVKPVVVREETGTVVCGNGTLAAAQALGWTHIAAVVKSMDQATATALAIADNQTAALAEWDNAVLDKLLADLVTGQPELDAMLAELAKQSNPLLDLPEPGAGGDEFDATPDDGPTRTRPGDLWIIGGKHRLLCGDSTKAEDVARVMGGEKAGLCFTSPPYAQQRDYGDKAKEKVQDWDGLMCGVFANLPMTPEGQVLVNLGLIHRDCEWIPYWENWIEWMRGQGWRRFGWYVWDQGSGLCGDWNGRLAPSHEFIWHFNQDAVRPDKFIEKKPESITPAVGTFRRRDGQTQAMSSPESGLQTHKIPDSVIRVGRQVGSDGHPAQFPIGLPLFIIKSWLADVYDPFLGSGTTLIAAHRLGRKAYGIEIEPKYCDVILKRAEAEGLTVEKG